MFMLFPFRRYGVFFMFLLVACGFAHAGIRLPHLFSDGMVLQRNRPVTVWGWADAGQQVKVTLSGEGKAARRPVTAEGVADASGRFEVSLPASKASGPLQLSFTCGDETVMLRDVWVGDVWMCSGQSNIDTHLERVYPQYPEEIDGDSTRRVRLFQVQNVAALDGSCADVRSEGWKTLSRNNAWHFSALGYFLGKRMEAETGVVQGVIQSSWGGTPIEAWLPLDTVRLIDARRADEAVLYADADLRRAATEANNQAARRWNQLLESIDPGVSGHWNDPQFDDTAWPSANQFELPVQPQWGFCGTFWLRQHLHIDARHAGQPARLLLGTLIDADYTYINGKLVGHTGYQYPPRRYDIPEGLLHEGDNVIAVRFVNRGQRPQFIREKPYEIRWKDGSVQPLSAQWQYHDGTQMPNQPSMPTGFQNMAGATFNGMLLPLTPYTLSGIVWYQGESNTDRSEVYQQELRSLMHCWREMFRQPELPFVVVQLANYMAPSAVPQESGWARLRESQRLATQSDPHAELAVAINLGEANDIHPLRKKELAERVALAFDRLVFGKRVQLSPLPLGAEAGSDGSVVVTFDQPVTGTQGFELATEGGTFHTVSATNEGTRVVLHGQGSRVRYAWKHNPVEADLRATDKRGLPASPFEMEVKKE